MSPESRMSPVSKRATDGIDEALEAADPVERSLLVGERIESALNDIGAAVTARSRRGPAVRRRWIARPRTVLLVGAAIVVTSAAVASAAVLSAHTGRFPTKAEQAMGGPGEALNPAAPDFRNVALELASDIPYPAGYESWRDFLISDEIRTADGGVGSTGALHGWFAASAFCAWVHTWRQADLAGDVGTAARAGQVVSEATGWKAVTDEDPDPDPSVPGDGGSTQFTLFGWMLPYQEAVLAGDRARVEHLLAVGYGDKCSTSDPDWRAQMAAHPEWGTFSRGQLAREYERFLASGRS
jgi:hypothetical protein